MGGRRFAVGGRRSTVRGRQSAVGSGQSAVGSRQSAVGSRQSAVGSRQSAVDGNATRRVTGFGLQIKGGRAKWEKAFRTRFLRFAICDLRFAICDLRFAICDLRVCGSAGLRDASLHGYAITTRSRHDREVSTRQSHEPRPWERRERDSPPLAPGHLAVSPSRRLAVSPSRRLAVSHLASRISHLASRISPSRISSSRRRRLASPSNGNAPRQHRYPSLSRFRNAAVTRCRTCA
ncbi:AraC family transcriptional regulator [Burkholderia pseudomallei]|nr:AraC family transcriptional regulator [Burkholderia pseudomallei]